MTDEQKAIAKTPDEELKDQIRTFTLGKGLVEKIGQKQADLFMHTAFAWGLNPLKREIHCLPFWNGKGYDSSIVVGYEVYLKYAERSGKLSGWKVEIIGNNTTTLNEDKMRAVITIYRKDWTQPFVHEVYWDEAQQTKSDGTPMPQWKKMGRFMLKKVAIAQGFRLCFPEDLGGLPYTEEETEGLEIEKAPSIKSFKAETAKEETKPVVEAKTTESKILLKKAEEVKPTIQAKPTEEVDREFTDKLPEDKDKQPEEVKTLRPVSQPQNHVIKGFISQGRITQKEADGITNAEEANLLIKKAMKVLPK